MCQWIYTSSQVRNCHICIAYRLVRLIRCRCWPFQSKWCWYRAVFFFRARGCNAINFVWCGHAGTCWANTKVERARKPFRQTGQFRSTRTQSKYLYTQNEIFAGARRAEIRKPCKLCYSTLSIFSLAAWHRSLRPLRSLMFFRVGFSLCSCLCLWRKM